MKEPMIKHPFGLVSFVTTVIGACLMSIFGDLLVAWLFYIAAAITGIVHNCQVGNKSMYYTFLFYLFVDCMAVGRLLFS